MPVNKDQAAEPAGSFALPRRQSATLLAYPRDQILILFLRYLFAIPSQSGPSSLNLSARNESPILIHDLDSKKKLRRRFTIPR